MNFTDLFSVKTQNGSFNGEAILVDEDIQKLVFMMSTQYGS